MFLIIFMTCSLVTGLFNRHIVTGVLQYYYYYKLCNQLSRDHAFTIGAQNISIIHSPARFSRRMTLLDALAVRYLGGRHSYDQHSVISSMSFYQVIQLFRYSASMSSVQHLVQKSLSSTSFCSNVCV